MAMTVSELKKQLRGVDGKLEVFVADHDHGEYEYSSPAHCAKVIDISEEEDERIIEEQKPPREKYVIIRP